jgi:hypothetical protein
MDMVPDHSHLTTEDLESVRAASAALHEQGWRKEFTIEEMIRNWAWVVAEVERGYSHLVTSTPTICTAGTGWPKYGRW